MTNPLPPRGQLPPRGDWLAAEDQAPYPRDWTPQQRLDMTWWATHHNVHVAYDHHADDEGASGWLGALAGMERHKANQRNRIGAARAAGTPPPPQLALEPPDPEPEYPDPTEPRHPRAEFEQW